MRLNQAKRPKGPEGVQGHSGLGGLKIWSNAFIFPGTERNSLHKTGLNQLGSRITSFSLKT